jgi:hypothetical protein
MRRHHLTESPPYACIQKLISAEEYLTVLTGVAVEAVVLSPTAGYDGDAGKQRIGCVRLSNGEVIRPLVIVDGTANGKLAAMAGAAFNMGRESDGKMQSATLTFGIKDFEVSLLRNPHINTWDGYWDLNDELSEIYKAAKAANETRNPKSQICAFAYPDGKTLLFNCNEVGGVDPTRPESLEAGRALAESYVKDLIRIIKRHPAFAHSSVAFISSKFGVREGRRITGDYILTGEDCLGEARFDDMVAAGANDADVHDPDLSTDTLRRIPNTQYYHIPYRSLIARDHVNLLLGSRCISGDFTAHSSCRVMSAVTGIGQAAGAAAALTALNCDGEVRKIDPAWIRYVLDAANQFTEGKRTPPPLP